MPHQCLKCGSVFADGSPQILRGCPECGGARFFFTDEAMSDDERGKLKEKANKNMKDLIQEMLTNDSIPINIKESLSQEEEWVEFTVVEDSEVEGGKEKVVVSGPVEIKKDMVKSIEDLIFKEEGRSRKYKFRSKAQAKKEAKEAIKAMKAEKSAAVASSTQRRKAKKAKKPAAAPPKVAVTKKKTKKAGKPAAAASTAPRPKKEGKKAPKKEDQVAVISIDEYGVYDIDVEKLLEKSPIIIQKGGSYMVHLPSAFKRSKKKSAA